jgi:glycosyltransferase involved in cell wall biosynthesis
LISCCVITKNEERHLARCLSSVSDIIDEIVIVDSGSTDNTIDVAKDFGAKIISINWIDDYSYARNIAIESATQPWIIFLDADETLVNGGALRQYLKQCSSEIIGTVVSRYDHFIHPVSGKKSTVPVGIIRIFRNHPDIKFTYPVHEIAGPSIGKLNKKIEPFLESHIFHHIDQHTNNFIEAKQSYYLKLIENALGQNPTAYWLIYQKGKTLWFFSKLNHALNAFDSIIQAEEASPELKVASLNNSAVIYLLQEKYELAQACLNQSLKIDSKQSQAHFILGDLFLELRIFPKAILHYSKVKTSLHLDQSNTFIPGGLFLFKFQKYYRIALGFYKLMIDFLGDFYLKKSLENNDQYVDALYLKAKRLIKKRLESEAIKILGDLEQINPGWEKVNELRLLLGS